MGKQYSYVCSLTEPGIAEAYADLRKKQSELDERQKFMKKQADAIAEEWQSAWKRIFDIAQEKGFIAKSVKYEDYGLQYNDESMQLLSYKRRSDMPPEIAAMLEKLGIGVNVKIDLED